MRRKIILLFLLISFLHLNAQLPQRRKPTGELPPRDYTERNEHQYIILNIPEIEDISLEQRRKLSETLGKEYKEVSELIEQKADIQKQIDENQGLSGKEMEKNTSKINKLEQKINKKKEDYDKKYRSILSTKQYQVFSDKKDQIEFKTLGKPGRELEKDFSVEWKDGNRLPPPRIREEY